MTRRTTARFLLPLLLITAGVTAGDTTAVVEIVIHGKYFIEPATVRVMAAVEPNTENRTLRIEADSEEMFRASDLTLNGADEKRLHVIVFKNLPAGAYTVRARVLSAKGVRGTAANSVLITGTGLK